ncbi:MAG: segregation/condensation protein A [Candidatus Aminicenantes bacterium]|nr:segregation/condensation protein A [Candidatus Aminicenantes bacterium]
MAYKIKLDIFEGPLDLLLYLVKKDELNIYDIPVAQVTEQYLAYLELMRLLDLDIAGQFLVMAATLMQIKSRMLLPKDETNNQEEEEVDPREELVQQLLEYQRFKEIASELRQREQRQQGQFRRKPGAISPDLINQPDDVYFEASIFDLINAFTQALQEVPRDLFYEVVKDEFTVEQKIHDILHLLLNQEVLTLIKLFRQAKNKLEIIATFLAVLELIRLKEITVRQKGLFGEIEIIRNLNSIIAYGRR